MSKTAEFIRTLTDADGWKGDARLYRLSDPIVYTDFLIPIPGLYDYVVVSVAPDPETGTDHSAIFAADEAGMIGAVSPEYFAFGLDHAEALSRAGYTVA
jgi:hypothetical protein